jgi:hypothetical protein
VFFKIFPKNQLFPRLRYNKDKGYPDVDLIIENADIALFIECSAKWITQKAMMGNSLSIINVMIC